MVDAKVAYLSHLADAQDLMILGTGLTQETAMWPCGTGQEKIGVDGITIKSWYRGCTRCGGLKDVRGRCHGAVYRANCVAKWEYLQAGEEELRLKALEEEKLLEKEKLRLKALKEEQEADEWCDKCRR